MQCRMIRAIARAERKPSSEAGTTLLELIMVCAILVILSASALPVARYAVKRQKEAELKRDLREMRDSIDRYKDAADRNLIRVEVGTEGYPPDLATLVTGVDLAGPTSSPGSNIGTPAGTIASQSNGFGAGAGQSGIGQAGGLSSSPQGSILGTLFGTQSGTTASSAGGASGAAGGSAGTAVRHVRFLRRIPVDPMTGQAMWGLRSVQDDPDSKTWGGNDVFDVFSMSDGMALDGTKYSDW
jgi:type II secretory pathway pseudopilin PulG